MKEELLALVAQGLLVFQLPIAIENVISSHYMGRKIMPKVAPIKILSSIL
jgi:hypothetical protein